MGGITYSTEHGRMCPDCEQPIAACACPRRPEVPRGDGVVRVSRQTKGRKGAGVTLVTGLPLDDDALRALGGALKRACGSGGTVKAGTIEIQGDHRDRVVQWLKDQGYDVRRAGG